jgi:hypothetical protein
MVAVYAEMETIKKIVYKKKIAKMRSKRGLIVEFYLIE